MTAVSPPRYRVLANVLREQILDRTFSPGDLLPTEVELCKTHAVSRHTAREALRILLDEGLIERRRGVGTTVRSPIAERGFAQTLSDFDELLQYARDAELTLDSECDASPAEIADYGLDGAAKRFVGVRRFANGAPLAHTVVFVPEKFAPTREQANAKAGLVSEWIEGEHGVITARLVQRFTAAAMPSDVAHYLDLEAGAPTLRALRWYRDAADRVIVASDSHHCATDFAYDMTFKRAR